MAQANLKDQLKDAPFWIKVLAIFYYILSVLGVIGFVAVIINGDINFLNRLLITVLILLPSTLFFFTGKGLWKGENWSRTLAIVISSFIAITLIVFMIILYFLSKRINQNLDEYTFGNLNNLLDIVDMKKFVPKAIIGVGINLIIVLYLFLNKRVKEFFERR